MTDVRKQVFILLHFEIRKLNSKRLPKVTQLLAARPRFQTRAGFKARVLKDTTCYYSKTLPSPWIPTISAMGKAGRRESRLAVLCIKHALCFLGNFRGCYTHLTMSF